MEEFLQVAGIALIAVAILLLGMSVGFSASDDRCEKGTPTVIHGVVYRCEKVETK